MMKRNVIKIGLFLLLFSMSLHAEFYRDRLNQIVANNDNGQMWQDDDAFGYHLNKLFRNNILSSVNHGNVLKIIFTPL